MARSITMTDGHHLRGGAGRAAPGGTRRGCGHGHEQRLLPESSRNLL